MADDGGTMANDRTDDDGAEAVERAGDDGGLDEIAGPEELAPIGSGSAQPSEQR